MLGKLIKRLSPAYLRYDYFLFKAKLTGRYKTARVSFPGYKLTVADVLSFAGQYWEIILKKSYFFESPNPQPIIIDCGGNIGLSALYFAKLYPKATIKVIEADTQIAAICKHNLETNRVSTAEVIAKAAWTKNGTISFRSEGADAGKISAESSASNIPCLDFNEYLEQFPSIDFLKIDIEGAETDVLMHCRTQLKKVKYLFVEYHSVKDQPQRLDTLLGILKENGFRYYMEDMYKRENKFTGKEESDFDLQLNIYASNTEQ